MTTTNNSKRWLPGVPYEEIEKIFKAAPGNEIDSRKIDSPESSAALAANTFGFFLNRAHDLPLLPECDQRKWPPVSLALEETVRFPWRGGRHPVLDALVITPSELIGIESKRFEPFRGNKKASFSSAYWRRVWGERMKGYENVRDKLHNNVRRYKHLDSAQLVKHAFALRTQIQPGGKYEGRKATLFYIYAEPECWPKDGRPIDKKMKFQHKEEIKIFTKNIMEDEVKFIACAYGKLLADWKQNRAPEIRAHTKAIVQRFSP